MSRRQRAIDLVQRDDGGGIEAGDGGDFIGVADRGSAAVNDYRG
jgi:hypothetical protein